MECTSAWSPRNKPILSRAASALLVSCISAILLLASVAIANLPPARDDGAVRLASAIEAFEASDYPQAVRILQSAAGADPNNAKIQFWLVRNYYEIPDDDGAVRSGERAIALEPKISEYHQWLGKAYGLKAEHASIFTALGWARKAHKEFQAAVDLDGRNLAARQDLIEYLCRAPGMAGGSEEKASSHIKDVLVIDPGEGHYARGNCRRQKKDYAAADAEFSKALESPLKNPDLIYDIGDHALKHNQPERMLAVADAGRKAAPADPRADFYRAVALFLQQKGPAEVERLLRSYLRRAPVRTAYPRPCAASDWLGRFLERQKRPNDAAVEYRAALARDSKCKAAREALQRVGKGSGM